MSQEQATELAVIDPPSELQARAAQSLVQPFTVDTLVERVNLVREAMKRCMVEGQHYGTIPGCGKKPTLLKPGAELLGTLFQLGQRYRVQERLLPNDHILYTITCTQFYRPNGADLAEGVGCCTTMEEGFRNRIKGTKTPFDLYNNALKIGAKRALVAATLNATGASEVFTQDIEENPSLYQDSQQASRQPLAKAPKPRAGGDGNGRAPAPKLELVTGYVSRVWENLYQGERYFMAKLDKGQQILTTDAELGSQLLECETGEAFRAWCEPSPKPGKFYLKSFSEAAEAAAEARA